MHYLFINYQARFAKVQMLHLFTNKKITTIYHDFLQNVIICIICLSPSALHALFNRNARFHAHKSSRWECGTKSGNGSFEILRDPGDVCVCVSQLSGSVSQVLLKDITQRFLSIGWAWEAISELKLWHKQAEHFFRMFEFRKKTKHSSRAEKRG